MKRHSVLGILFKGFKMLIVVNFHHIDRIEIGC